MQDTEATEVELEEDDSLEAEPETGELAEGEDTPEAETDPSGVEDSAEEEQASSEDESEEEEPEEPEGDLPEGEALEAYVQSAFALLFASPEPLSEKRLRGLLVAGPEESPGPAGKVGKAGIELVVETLTERIAASQLPIELRRISGGLRLFTDARLAEVVQRLDKTRRNEKISHAGLETLAIVAYRQPVTKAEIEAIRGVQAGPMLRQLTDRRLIKVSGRADQPGAPLLYGTTSEFLDRFGLADLDELPRDGELARD